MGRMNQLFVLWRWMIMKNVSKYILGILFLTIIANSIEIANCAKSSGVVTSLSEHSSFKKMSSPWRKSNGVVISEKVSIPVVPFIKKSTKECNSSKQSEKCKKQRKMKNDSRKVMISPNKVRNVGKINKGLSEMSKSILKVKTLNPKTISKINKFIDKKKHYCKLESFKGLSCQKLKFSTWLANQLERNQTKLTSWLEIVRKSDNETRFAERSLSQKEETKVQPDNWPEATIYKLIKAWGGPEELLVFYKYKQFLNSRELKISLPYKSSLKISTRKINDGRISKGRSASDLVPSTSVESARFFWDPGFNLKLKLPFFRDELKVAVSTGPSFVAGIGVGIALLIVKSMFAPFLLGMKWMMYNFFLKESSPFELMKLYFASHAPEQAPWESAPIPPPSVEHYSPPPIRNHFDHRPYGRPHRPPPPPPPRHHHHHHPPYPRGPKGFRPPPPPPPHYHGPYDMDYHHAPPFDLNHQFTHPTPMIQTLSGENPTMSQLEHLYRAQLAQDGLGDGAANQVEPHDSQSYIPSTGLQAEVEHFDPFYSPLLSKIDSIFTHLGHEDEGCRERVVCSIYKFPVKYAPYSNLLSAQLSKHQSELKRPVTSSPKILRYFRYMKAAKDGQGGDNCIELYPKCNSDTDSVSSLPMITTFHQLSELLTAEPSQPGVALASAG